VASDTPADVELELSYSPEMAESWTVPAGRTNRFLGTSTGVRDLEVGRRVYWRPHLRRRGVHAAGPVRSFPVLPDRESDLRVRVAVAACASQFGPIFGHLANQRPDVFVWQGDLNYPDTHGPFAQTMSGYAGIWRDFLANPVLQPTLQTAAFAPQRDDHDYALQDANSTEIPRYPWGIEPWDALMNRRLYYRFRAGAAEVWVLDQRRHKSDPDLPDTPEKTLLGQRQRRWLFRTLASSDAAFKVICSPCTVFMVGNPSDGNWGSHYQAERNLLIQHLHDRVSGRAIFLTGDYHLTAVHDGPGQFEARAAPMGIPVPNDVTLVNPLGAVKLRREPNTAYADNRCHFTLLEVRGRGSDARLELSLVREDGAIPYRRRFTAA
jgi:phosphodiesterase/alkaline phosphatase D-like protein